MKIKILTRKEKELKLLKALDLRVGDIIKIYRDKYPTEYKIVDEEYGIMLKSENNALLYVETLLISDFEYHQKTLGEYKCRNVNCSKCPLNFLQCGINEIYKDSNTLSYVVESINRNFSLNDAIKKGLRDMLNQVVEDESEILNNDK